ncbi:hypothetical protein [Streptomyces sp. MJP52]|uniref:hypothetical protein n=1 Tax=Streptomyces sp. MJP52 TaxID=2940555 RepID=UPI00247317C2|nr:hypothetical protein [Streptomyces sp. MJP52]MDH6228335.1 hypothetical protein [Streptomyces sp. MJP52]
MNTLTRLPPHPAGPPRGATAKAELWLDLRHTSPEAAAPDHAGAAHTAHDVLPAVAGGPPGEHRSARGVLVAGPVLGIAGYRRLTRELLSGAPAPSGARPLAVEYSVPAVDAVVNARLDRIGGWEAKAPHDRAGIAGAHLLYDAFRRDLRSPAWGRALGRGAPVPRLLWSTRPPAGPDRGAEYAERCLLPGTAVALSPEALSAFTRHAAVTAPASADLAEARRVAGILDRFGIRLAALDGPAPRA